MQPKVKPSVIIYADTDNCNIHFCYEPKDHKNSYNHEVERCSAEPFSDDFFEKFASVVNLYKKSHPKIAFDKTACMLETFLRNGGIQFQLNHTSHDELLCAKESPDEYQHLKVRVTGYSDYFTRLEAPIQDSIIQRYEES